MHSLHAVIVESADIKKELQNVVDLVLISVIVIVTTNGNNKIKQNN